MNGRDKLRAAFGAGGTTEVAAVLSYDTLLARDLWAQLTNCPWWYRGSGLVEKELAWARDLLRTTGLDWLKVNPCPSRADREAWEYEQRPDGSWWRRDNRSGQEIRIDPPIPGGKAPGPESVFRHEDPPAARAEIDAILPLVPEFDQEKFRQEGRGDVLEAFGKELAVMLYAQVGSPLTVLFGKLGFEGAMLLIGQDPELASYACQRLLNKVRQTIREMAAAGVEAIWIEECFTDQISPDRFWSLNVPAVTECVAEIHRCGLRSIYYYCGDPRDRIDAILATETDAVHFEEGKKGFANDILDLAKSLKGKCMLFGNLDAIGVMQNGDEGVLRAALRRQLEAWEANAGRFAVSIGSPVTPTTPAGGVREYTRMVREISGQRPAR